MVREDGYDDSLGEIDSVNETEQLFVEWLEQDVRGA